MLRRGLIVAGAVALLAFSAPSARASEMFPDVNLSAMSLKVNKKGEALVTYTRASDHKTLHVLVWGAVDANTPNPTVPQVRFKYDYAGGWGKYRNGSYWKTFKNVCTKYTGPKIVYLTVGCDAPDGTHWALQTWQRALPLLGFDPWLPKQTAFETHISHWTDSAPLATLDASPNWTYNGSAVGLFGRFAYGGQPVYGFASTATGAGKDRYARNVYIDTYNSAYGSGWKRESGILAHKNTGTFCHSFVPQKPFPDYPSQAMRPAAPGSQYRVTAMGPGVTPDVQWTGSGLGSYSPSLDGQFNTLFDQWMAGDRICAPER